MTPPDVCLFPSCSPCAYKAADRGLGVKPTVNNDVESTSGLAHIAGVEWKDKLEGNDQQAGCAREHAAKLEAELQKIYDGTLAQMDEKIILSASAGESMVFYYKMRVTIDTLQRISPMMPRARSACAKATKIIER